MRRNRGQSLKPTVSRGPQPTSVNGYRRLAAGAAFQGAGNLVTVETQHVGEHLEGMLAEARRR